MEGGNYRVRRSMNSFVNNDRKSKLLAQHIRCVFYDFHTNIDYPIVNQEGDIGESAWLCVIGNEYSNMALKV
jgi:hypothetical protein